MPETCLRQAGARVTRAAEQPCYHPLCSDIASRWHKVVGQRAARGACLAHHLEHRYNEGKRRMREATAAKRAGREGNTSYRGEPLRPCGTSAAAKRHRERGEAVCEPCRVADNKRRADGKAARKARRAQAVDTLRDVA